MGAHFEASKYLVGFGREKEGTGIRFGTFFGPPQHVGNQRLTSGEDSDLDPLF